MEDAFFVGGIERVGNLAGAVQVGGHGQRSTQVVAFHLVEQPKGRDRTDLYDPEPAKIGRGGERMSSPQIDFDWLLSLLPAAEAKLYCELVRLIPAPRPESTDPASRRQIKMKMLAGLTGFLKRWVIELLARLEKKNLIRAEGGRGAAKWIQLLPPGIPLLGGTKADQPKPKEAARPAPRPGKAKAPEAAASQPKRRQETTPSAKPDAEVNGAPPAEKPAEIPKRRQEIPIHIPPPTPPPSYLVVPAPIGIPPPATAPANPAPANPAPANPLSPSRSTESIPSAPPPRPGAPIEELLAFVYSEPVPEDLIGSLMRCRA
jgi:hypothetical protein